MREETNPASADSALRAANCFTPESLFGLVSDFRAGARQQDPKLKGCGSYASDGRTMDSFFSSHDCLIPYLSELPTLDD